MLASNLVTFESSPQGSMGNRAGKNSKISVELYTATYIYTSINNLELDIDSLDMLRL